MKCEYCDKELNNDSKYCDFCGAKVDFAENSVNQTTKKQTTKKKVKPGKIIFLVFLFSTIVVLFIYGMGYVMLEKVNEISGGTGEPTSEFFDYYIGGEYSFDDESGKIDYEGIENFKAGEIDSTTNSYSSDFANVKIQFPANWEIKTDTELKSIYSSQGVYSRLYKNNIFVYDLYATDTFTGSSFYISFYNADYFNEYESIEEFNKEIKDEMLSYESEYEVDYADDSSITINGEKYYQLAARISTDNNEYYAYDFTRYVDGYYMQISIFAYDLDTVGSVIDYLTNA